MSASISMIEVEEAVTSVHIDGLAVLKIIKHCQESLPQLVTGSLLGLTVAGGILEITHAFPFPDSAAAKDAPDKDPDLDEIAALEGHEYQLEMMKMLREVNVDNNCVGWYQSTYLGSYSTASLLENQLSYQTELSPNAVVLLYDPTQSAHGNMALKCFRLSPEVIALKMENKNAFLEPRKIFQEIPMYFTNHGLPRTLIYNLAQGRYPHSTMTTSASAAAVSSAAPAMTITAANILPTASTGLGGARTANGSNTSNTARPLTSTLDEYYYDALFSPFSSTALLLKYPPLFSNKTSGQFSSDAADTTFDQLDLSTNPYLEKHLEFLCSWVEDLAMEQNKFQMYARSLATQGRMDKRRKDAASNLNTEMTLQEAWGAQDAPKRLESLLIANQIRNYCDQMDKYASTGFGKLFLAGGLQKEERTSL